MTKISKNYSSKTKKASINSNFEPPPKAKKKLAPSNSFLVKTIENKENNFVDDVFLNNFTSYSLPLKKLRRQVNCLYLLIKNLPQNILTSNFFINNTSKNKAQINSNALPLNSTFTDSTFTDEKQVNNLENNSEKVRIALVLCKHMKKMQSEKWLANYAEYCENNSQENISQITIATKNKTKATDVLAWNDHANNNAPLVGYGDIAICIPTVFANAKEDDVNKIQYILEITFHGMWHLFGMRHDYSEESLKKINMLQKKYIKKWNSCLF